MSNWVSEACDDWIGMLGGLAPGGVIGKSLKPLVERYGWEVTVRPCWKQYLYDRRESGERQYISAPDFANRMFGQYLKWRGDTERTAEAAPLKQVTTPEMHAVLANQAHYGHEGEVATCRFIGCQRHYKASKS